MNVLVINCGSSSVKFKIINVLSQKSLVCGCVDGIGLSTCVFKLGSKSSKVKIKNHHDALSYILKKIDVSSIGVVGHRFVHGGVKYSGPVVVTKDVLKDLSSLKKLAPLHNSHNLAGIRVCMNLLDVPQVVVFDTAFHSAIPERASTYALPLSVSKKFNLKKFGFHGISHSYLSNEAHSLLGKKNLNLITCHLGNGCSVSCVKNGVSIDTSMGFSPLQGLVMGSRSGDIDPGIVIFLQEELGWSSKKISNFLNNKSGLLGLCGESDMRSVYEKVLSNDDSAALALDVFCYRIVHYIGAYIAHMGAETHAIVFSGGIGEGGFYVRKKVCNSLKHLGVLIDYEKNMYNKGVIDKPMVISDSKSSIKVLAIPTNEELMIALEAAKLVK